MRNSFSRLRLLIWTFFVLAICSCKRGKPESDSIEKKPHSFIEEVDFLRNYTDLIVLETLNGKGKVAVSPELQGRVMTSTAKGWSGKSYGWINRKHFISGDTLAHINVFGGEERLWFGPEGGQYSIFFKKGDDFTLDNWYTPKLIDLEHFDIVNKSTKHVKFSKKASLTNYSDFTFNFNIERHISVLSELEIKHILESEISKEISVAGYQTINTIENIGDEPWKKETGLLSIWLLGMLNHSPTMTVVIPYKIGDESSLGPIVIDDYFGKVPSDRLKVTEKAIFFKADGQQRGKIGVSPQRAKNMMGSYDPQEGSLTIVIYNRDPDASDYVNSKWEIQKEPYKGDVINSYNDGPPEPGAAPLGPFYELETSSPAAALSVGEKISHEQYTLHLEGNEKDLNVISLKVLGVSLKEISTIFK